MTRSPGLPSVPRTAGLLLAVLSSCATTPTGSATPWRPLSFEVDGRWVGKGISYGPHRDGQRPGGPGPSVAQLKEDLALLRPHWPLWRLYSADAVAGDVLELLRAERAGVSIILGAWIAPESDDAARAANAREVAELIRLANAYPDIVRAVSVGNETQVDWSDHKVPPELLIGYLRQVRAATRVPVTTADDFGYWLKPQSDAVAREVDFLMVHIYAMWNGQPLEKAVDFTRDRYEAVAARHPGRLLVVGELGWATRKHTEGEQARLIKGEPGEPQQERFHQELQAWVGPARIPHLYFEAFDENWKGGPHPDEVEKHWGLFRADRTPKAAMQPTPPR